MSKNSKQKKLMILGAGPYQLPAIRKAAALGYYVITVDYLPENIGHKHSHQFVNCSTVEMDSILNFAQELEIDGIITFASDVAVQTVSFVAENLGLPGCGPKTALTMSNKAKFREFQRANGLCHPNFVTGKCLGDIEIQIRSLSTPLLFKPVDTSGSRGIVQVNDFNKIQLNEAFEFSRSYSRSKTVCAEEYVPGIDVSGDGFMLNGSLYGVVTKKFKHGYIPSGHRLPTDITLEDQGRVFAEVSSICNALDYTIGPLDFDVRVDRGRVVVLEMSPRLGGNGIPSLIKRATGVDLISETLKFSLGEKVEFPEWLKLERSCGSWVIGSDIDGQLMEVATEDELMSAIPEIFDCYINCKVGDDVSKFIHSGNNLGYVLFDCPPMTDYEKVLKRIQNALRLKVISPI